MLKDEMDVLRHSQEKVVCRFTIILFTIEITLLGKFLCNVEVSLILPEKHWELQPTLALRTPRYCGHPDNTDRN